MDHPPGAYSYLLGGLLPHARVKLYPDAAHGFLFQHHAEFAADVDAFLTAPTNYGVLDGVDSSP